MKKIIYLCILIFSFPSQEVVAQLNHIRWGTSKNPLEGLTITWQSTGTADMIKWGYTAAFEQGSFPGVGRSGYSDTFFDYKFPILNANTTLYYQLLNSQNSTWTSTKTFNTAPPLNTANFSFIATGDSRGGAPVWQAISDLANLQQTDLTIFNGDIVSDAGESSQWDDWFDAGAPFLEKNLVLHALGNHDALSIPNYLNNFELPKSTSEVDGTELYYAVNYGEAVIISLDSEIPEDTDQYNWLITTLQANQNKRWKIITFHKPFYTIGPHIGEMDDYFTTWWKAFDDYGVDLILTGHDHMYERAKPINRNISTTSPVPVYGSGPNEGRCQIVCGGAGAGLTNLTSGWYIESFLRSHNFCKFDVTHNTLCGNVYDETNLLIDSFCIDKTPLATVTQKINFNPIVLAPNPAMDNFRIDYTSSNFGELIISVFDMNGKLINTKKSLKSGVEFSYKYDASLLQSGVYTVELQMGNQKDHALFIKK
jgi:hypothetical protein